MGHASRPISGRLAPTREEMRRLSRVAQGQEPADLVLQGGALLNVFTEEIQEGWGVAVAGGRVAAVGPDVGSLAGGSTEVVDLAGDLVAPGLVEGHTHIGPIGLQHSIDLQVAAGVTTTITESMEFGFVGGVPAVRAFLEDAAEAAGRVFVTVPTLIGIDPIHDAALEAPEAWIKLLDEPAVLGVGEIYWADLLRGHERTELLVAAALERGLAVEGHGAGARLPALNAQAAWGIGDDHEGISAADLAARLRLGLRAFARQGATRQDIDAYTELWQPGGPSLRRMSLVTDGVEIRDQLELRSLNHVVWMAVDRGLSLATAWRMASLSPAERFGLDRWIGGLGPGMLADLAVIPRTGPPVPRLVLVGGEPPRPPTRHRYPDALYDSVKIAPFDPGLLSRPPGRGPWRAMELVAPMVTREAETDGTGALPVLCADRLGRDRAFRGLLLGLGLTGGAIALTTGWESAGVTVVGDNAADMDVAWRRLADLHGGVVVTAGGQVRGEWRAELLGVQSQAPVGEVLEAISSVHGALRALGCDQPNPVMTVETLTTAAIPHLRIHPGGYTRLKDGAQLGLEL